MTKSRWVVVLGTFLLIGLGFYLGSKLIVDLSLTTLSSSRSEEFQNYQSYSKKFPTHDGGLIISLKSEKGFTTRSEFQKIDKLCQDLESEIGLTKISSLTNLKLPEKTGFGTRKRSLLKLKSKALFDKSYARLVDYKDITPKFLSRNREAMRIFIEVDDDLKISKVELMKIIDHFDFEEVHLSGRKIYKDDLEKKLSFDAFWLPIISGSVLLLLFLIWFQDVRSLFLILTILGLNSALVSSVFWLTNINVGILTATVPLLIIVLSFCDIVHVIHRFKKLDPTLSREERIVLTTAPLRLSLWLTSLTTFTAFALFFLSGTDEIIDFAVVTCSGIVIAYLTARFVLPVFLLFFQITNFKRKEAFTQLSTRLIKGQRHYKRIALISCFAILALFLATWNYSKINSSFYQQVGAKTALGKSMRFNDTYFDGMRSIEVIVSSENVLTSTTVLAVDEIEKCLLEEYKCRSVFSINSVIKRLNRYNSHGARSEYRLPDSLNKHLFEDVLKFKNELGLGNAMTADQKTVRIVGRLPDIGSAEADTRNKKLKQFLNTLKSQDVNVFVSGYSYVKDQSTNCVTKLILLGIGLSLLIAGIIAGIVFKSWKIAFISILPNLLPLLGALLFMEFLNIGLNATSVMALSILLGLSLDDTIYFLTNNYKKESREIEISTIDQSIKENTFPVMVTSLILATGFFILALSDFQSNRNIGILVGGMLLIALISDLLILPALLRVIAIDKEN